MSNAPNHPYRVTREFTGPRLTPSQQRVLSALVSVCPDSGCDATARAVAEAADLRLGSVVLVLRSLEKMRLAHVHPGEPGEDEGWAPTLTGRARVRHFPAASERPAEGEPSAGEPGRS